eukprot:gb/GEZN01016789.1/.p1 GENE.gb/GEZN01016789.1/~~gb/GEZN01016789.1/.p1  ORF type:complete len:206 (-),score=9.48 gb/GEZN01016789.1/:211-828(-)
MLSAEHGGKGKSLMQQVRCLAAKRPELEYELVFKERTLPGGTVLRTDLSGIDCKTLGVKISPLLRTLQIFGLRDSKVILLHVRKPVRRRTENFPVNPWGGLDVGGEVATTPDDPHKPQWKTKLRQINVTQWFFKTLQLPRSVSCEEIRYVLRKKDGLLLIALPHKTSHKHLRTHAKDDLFPGVHQTVSTSNTPLEAPAIQRFVWL